MNIFPSVSPPFFFFFFLLHQDISLAVLFELFIDSLTEFIQFTDSLSTYLLYVCFFAWLCARCCDAVLNILHSYFLHETFGLMEDQQEQCNEKSFMTCKYTVVLPCEHKGENADLKFGGARRVPGGAKQKPEIGGQGRDEMRNESVK